MKGINSVVPAFSFLMLLSSGTAVANDYGVDFKYYLTADANRVKAQILIYPTGEVVKTLVDAAQPRGSKTLNWDGTNSSGQLVGSGFYWYAMDLFFPGHLQGRFKFSFVK